MEDIYNNYELVVGLEVHMQLLTKSKAYASDPNEYGSLPNTNVSVISLGHPGTLPKVNDKVIDHAIRFGLACKCNIHQHVHFARKNYFYADLPKGYQISQDDTPICTGGYVRVKDANNQDKFINLTRAHLEEDSGKSMHDQDPLNTLIDLNRAGVPLIEVVTEPEIRSAQEAGSYLTELRKIVRYIGICDGNMEEGSMRCDANISVRRKGDTHFNTRTEVKNLNSIKNVQRAIQYEMKRQIDVYESGGKIAQDTLNFDAVTGKTSVMRSKELAHDYRYFPEPDLQPLAITDERINDIKKSMPALPAELYDKYTQQLHLSDYDAGVLTSEKEIALYFESLIEHTHNYKAACNWLTGDIKSYLNANALKLKDFTVSPKQMAGMIALIDEAKVSYTVAAQSILPALAESNGKSAFEIAEELHLIQHSDEDEIITIAKEVLAAWPDKVEAYRNGNKGLVGLFMGEFMKKSKGKANPKMANELIRKMLDS